jgi:Proteasomal ATPase OB C-terminal domain
VRITFSFGAGKCVVLKTSTRQTYFLPVIGLVDAADLTPNDLVGVNKDSYLVLDKLPAEYDSRVKAMEVRARCHLPQVASCAALNLRPCRCQPLCLAATPAINGWHAAIAGTHTLEWRKGVVRLLSPRRIPAHCN